MRQINMSHKFADFFDKLGNSHISTSMYDLAWVLRSRVMPELSQKEVITLIYSKQHKDGSWGGKRFYLHDRVINTISVVVALKELHQDRRKEFDKAENFLKKNILCLLLMK